MIKNFTELEIYQEAYELALVVSKKILELPDEERFSLADQLKRAARSVPANMAEGWAKKNYIKLAKRHFLDAFGSCQEMYVHIRLVEDLGYWDKEFCRGLVKRYQVLSRRIIALIKAWHW